jgi:hypothetical protein
LKERGGVVASKKTFTFGNYEQGLLISAITRTLSGYDDYSPDDMRKLKDLKI